MPKAKAEVFLKDLLIDRKSNLPFYRQIYNALRQAILTGRLRAGSKLPPTREFAKAIDTSRATVLLAFEHLFAEGYLEGKVGSGTFVSQAIPDKILQAEKSQPATVPKIAPVKLSCRGELMKNSTLAERRQSFGTPFLPGIPALREFPFQLWFRILSRQSGADFGYSEPIGYLPLREAIAEYLRTARAVRCEANHIVIVNGSQQALDLACRVLLDSGEKAWLEDPGYIGTREAMQAAGIEIVPVPVDREGMQVTGGKNLCPKAKLAYVTPSHQYPTGAVMSLARRLELLDWAKSANAWIIEDDYDSEYRYSGRPLASLQGIDEQARVIYIGTFSKVLFPALRVGYLVVPQNLVDAFVAAKAIADRNSSIVEQATLAEFLKDGHFGRHIRKMRLLYHERQKCLLESAQNHLAGKLKLESSEAGLHTIGWLSKHLNDKEISKRALQLGVFTPPLSEYSFRENIPPALVLGYAACRKGEIEKGVRKLAEVLT